MALLVLICLGGSLGWFASILARTEQPGEILRQIALGILLASIAGLIVNAEGVLGGVSVWALLAGTIATTLGIAAYHFWRIRNGERVRA